MRYPGTADRIGAQPGAAGARVEGSHGAGHHRREGGTGRAHGREPRGHAASSRGHLATAMALVATLLLGVLGAGVVVTASPPAEPSLAGAADIALSLMSVLVPLFGVLLARDLRRTPGVPAGPVLAGAVVFAAIVGAAGVLLCAATLAIAGAGGPDAWVDGGAILAGGVLVQVLAMLVGTGLGLLLRPVAVAFLATIVVPLGLWYGLGATDALRPARDWLAPYGSVQPLLTADMTAPQWLRWLVVALIWGVALNAVGAARRRSTPEAR